MGTPPNCRPECVTSGECPSDKACVNQKCRDPCPGVCGTNADCRVYHHAPICSCRQGYQGDAFTRCYPVPRKTYRAIFVGSIFHIYLPCSQPQPLYSWILIRIHAFHRHVVKMPSVVNIMAQLFAVAYATILVAHPIVDPNVASTRIVPLIWHVNNNVAAIHVQEHVVSMHNVWLLITYQCVSVHQD